MVQVVGQCSEPMVDHDDSAPEESSCLDDDRALALVDGQLSLEAREQIEAHLDRCAACRRFVSELAKESLFESPTEQPTDLEKTGYAPGRPNLLDVAFTVRDLAQTRIGVPNPEPGSRTAAAERRVEAPRAPLAHPPHAPKSDAPRSPAPPRSGAPPRPAPSAPRLDRTLALVLAIALSLTVLTGLAALISVAAFGYVFFRS
jgi:anti-sigma factor RsiW